MTNNDRINAVMEEVWQAEVKITTKLYIKVIHSKLDTEADVIVATSSYLRKKNSTVFKKCSKHQYGHFVTG